MRKRIAIVSDGSGETAATLVRAAVVHFSQVEVDLVRFKNVRTKEQLLPIIDEVFQSGSMIVYTMVAEHLKKTLEETCAEKGVVTLDLLTPLLQKLDAFFEINNPSAQRAMGALRAVDERYFKRIEAIEYTVKHDDGKTFSQLDQADIVLVGVSRTSKTPLSIFLSHKGWKVANIPLVLGQALPPELFQVDQRKVVGLIIDIESLQRIRKNRLEKFGQDPGGEYASLSHIAQEIEYAHQIFRQNRRWPVFNVTDRALEETASEITRIVASRMGWPDSAFF